MITLIVADKRIKLGPVDIIKVLRYTTETIYSSVEVASNFPEISMRPKSWMIDQIKKGEVDTVVQIGYTGTSTEIVRLAEEYDVENIVLIRS